jgi:hypothetical protein
MKTLKKGILPAAAVGLALVLASPAAALEGGRVVPPENSAVNQYTEGFPTAGGEKDAHDRRGGKRTPDKVLGERNTERLEQRGSAGRAVAELTAETAPVTAAPETSDESVVEETTAVGGGKGDGGPGDRTAVQKIGLDSAQPVALAFDPAEVDGSSGLGSVIGQAFGSSSGLGLLLPLLLLATIAWAIGYATRQRRVVG